MGRCQVEMKSNSAAGALRSRFTLIASLCITLALAACLCPATAHASAQGDAIAKAAASISYSKVTYQSKGTGTKAYLAACKKYMGSYYTKNKKQMQCNVPVATSVRKSGVDSEFAQTNATIYKYMKNSKDWTCLGNYTGKTSMLQPGDILIRIAGTTSYKKNGKTYKAATSHTCVYVGAKIASSVYNSSLKGTDADKGAPGSSRVFVSAHKSTKNSAKRSAACLETAKQAYADTRMIVFRYTGSAKVASDSSAAKKETSSESKSSSASNTSSTVVAAQGAAAIAKTGAEISYSRIVYKANGTGTKAYMKAVKKYAGSYYTKSNRQMQSNASLVTAVRASGVDKNFPNTLKKMYTYMNKSKQWECVGNYTGDVSMLQPGDILIAVKGSSTYVNKNGKTCKAKSNRACLYVGADIAASVYASTLKGTDADKGAPGSNRVFMSASKASNAAKTTAACLKTAKQVSADSTMLVYRYVG